MKNTIWKTGLAVLIICLTAGVYSGENLIKNGQFLDLSKQNLKSPNHWYYMEEAVLGEASGMVDFKEKPEGSLSNSYKVTGNALIVQWVGPVTPGATYHLSCKMKTADMAWLSQARFQIIWLDQKKKELMTIHTYADGTKEEGWDHAYVYTEGNVDWKTFRIRPFTAPENARFALIRFGKAGRNNAGTAWFTDFVMEKAEDADPFENRITTIPAGTSMDEAVHFKHFICPGSDIQASNQTEVSAYYDKDALNIRIYAHQQSIGNEQFIERVKDNHSDAVEIFLLPPGQKEQYHLIVNPSGNRFAQKEQWGVGSWQVAKSPWHEFDQVKTHVEIKEDAWITTVRIPFESMGLKKAPADGEEWRGNICRSVETRGSELSAWSRLDSPDFQRSASFGKFNFSKNSVAASNVRISQNGVSADLQNQSGKTQQFKISRVKHTKNGSSVAESETFTVAPRSSKSVKLDFQTGDKDLLWTEIRSSGKLIAKHSVRPAELFLAFDFLDPERVRTQTVYLANDIPFFIAWNMKHNFPAKGKYSALERYQKAVDCMIDVPEGVNFTGMIHDASAYNWKQSKRVIPSRKEFQKNGEKWNRYHFKLPIIVNWNEPQFLFFYECSLKEGISFEGKIRFISEGNTVSEYTKEFRTVKIGKVKKPFRRLPFNIGQMDAVTLFNWLPEDTLKHYYSLGFNTLSVPVFAQKNKEFYKGKSPKTSEDFHDLIYQQFLNADFPIFMNTVSVSTTPAEHAWTRADIPGTVGIKRDGTKCTSGGYAGAPGLCFNYRGEKHQQWIKSLINSAAFAKYRITWLSLDMEVWRDPAWDEICFCERCLKLYKEFCLQKNRPDLAMLDPRKADSDDFKKIWKEFQVTSASGFVTTAVDAVRNSVKGAKSTAPNGGFLSQDYSTPGSKNDGGSAYEEDSLNCYEMSLYHPAEGNYKKLLHVRRNVVGLNSKTLATGLSYGQTAGCPDWYITPADCKWSIYEIMVFGTRNVNYYYYPYIDPLRMKEIVNALNAVTPFENMILDGTLKEDLKASSSEFLMNRRTLGNESLIAVRTYYSKTDVTGTITVPDVNLPMNVYDCETGKIIGNVSPERPDFQCKVPARSCRLLYIGTEKQWNQRKF